MFSRKMRPIYKRWLILGLLSMGLLGFAYSDNIETVQGSLLCAQDCDSYWQICNDSCQEACSSTDAACNSCLTNCASEWNYCSEHATYCTSGTITYGPECQVDFGIHDSPGGSHYGYHEICNRIGYQNGCTVCPSGETCSPLPGGNPIPPPCL
jgi:hypothetical protein